MKKNYFFRAAICLSVLSVLTLILSCEKDEDFKKTEEGNANANYAARGTGVNYGDKRLMFSSGEEFTQYIYAYTEKETSEIYDLVSPFYSQGFYSLRTPAQESYHQDEIIQQYKERINDFKKSSNIHNYTEEEIASKIDETSSIVGSETIAALLNKNGEVQISDVILKFSDAGLFMCKKRNYDKLENYLDQKRISISPLNATDKKVLESFIPLAKSEAIPINDFVNYYMTPVIPLAPPGGGGGGSGGGGGYNPPHSDDNDLDGLDNYISQLTPCESRNTILGSIFGTDKICSDYYNGDKKRVRTQAYNYRLAFDGFGIDIDLYSVGIKVRNQQKIWPGWFRNKANVVAVGVRQFEVQYDYASVILPYEFSDVNYNRESYAYKPGNISYIVDYSPAGNDYNLIYNSNYPSYPNFIQDGLVIELTSSNGTIDDWLSDGEDALAAEALNEYFWSSAWGGAENILRTYTGDSSYENPDLVALVANYPNNGKVLVHKSYYSYCTNCRKKNKNFGFGGSGGFKISYDGTRNKFNYEMSSANATTIAPQNMRVKMYGAVKKDGNWHGSLLEYNLN